MAMHLAYEKLQLTHWEISGKTTKKFWKKTSNTMIAIHSLWKFKEFQSVKSKWLSIRTSPVSCKLVETVAVGNYFNLLIPIVAAASDETWLTEWVNEWMSEWLDWLTDWLLDWRPHVFTWFPHDGQVKSKVKENQVQDQDQIETAKIHWSKKKKPGSRQKKKKNTRKMEPQRECLVEKCWLGCGLRRVKPKIWRAVWAIPMAKE